jgi:hypothetical protein
MATKKQQRRRYQRARAHGRGVDGGHVEVEGERTPPRPKTRSGGARQARVIQPPSMIRAARRSVLLAGLFLVLLLVTPLGNKQSPAQKVFFAVWMFTMFCLVTLMTDRWAYKRYLKQQGKP